ncbi:MAG TPA: hypothetical protein VF021_10860 [Longimicrobiales bacterium]
MTDRIEFDPEFDEEVDFEADDEFEEALDYRSFHQIDVEELKARGREAWQTARERGRERLNDAAARGKTRLADSIENTATVLDDRLYGSAEYLRSRDVQVIRDDFVDTVRKRPLLSAGIALGAGYLIGKALDVPSIGRRRKKKSKLRRQIQRAVVSGLATMVASRLREAVLPGETPIPDEPPTRRSRPRSSKSRTRREY